MPATDHRTVPARGPKPQRPRTEAVGSRTGPRGMRRSGGADVERVSPLDVLMVAERQFRRPGKIFM